MISNAPLINAFPFPSSRCLNPFPILIMQCSDTSMPAHV